MGVKASSRGSKRVPLRFSGGNFKQRAVVVVLIVALAAGYSVGTIFLVPGGDAIGSGNLAKTFNDLVLSAAAIFFAFSFADARYWPTIGEAAGASYFYAWGAAVVLSMLVDWTGTYIQDESWNLVSVILWFISSALATLSIFRILRLGDPERLNSYLSRNLMRCFYRNDAERFLRATRESVVVGADLTVRDLTDQLSSALQEVKPSSFTIHTAAEFVSEVTWAAFGSSISGLTAARSIERVLSPEIILGKFIETTEKPGAQSSAVIEGIQTVVPLLTRFDSQAKVLMSDSTRHDYEVIATTSLKLVKRYVSLLDPEPKASASITERFTISLDVEKALDCLRTFTLRPCAENTSSIYCIFQHLTGARYAGDYWSGSPIISDMITAMSPVRPIFKHEIEWILASSILSSTLPSITEVLSSKMNTKEFIGVASWFRIMVSMGDVGDADQAHKEWAESVLQYVPRKTNPGDPAYDEFEISLALAVLYIMRLMPWKSSRRSREARMFYEMFGPAMREKLRLFLLTLIGNELTEVDGRQTARIRKALVAQSTGH